MPPEYRRHFINLADRSFVSVLALLVSYAAACLAGRLAGSLAFAASAVYSAFTQIASFDCLNSFHYDLHFVTHLQLLRTTAF